jgi:hypothetical protein
LKVQDLLFAYLSEQKHLSLPGIGIFEISDAESQPAEKDDTQENYTILFTPDKNTGTEESLLLFLKERTGKMKALAQSDLDSFIYNGQQLLNINKPFDIPGIGVIQRSSDGIVSFQQGIAKPEMFLNDHTKKLVHTHGTETSIHNEHKKSSSVFSTSQKRQFIIFGIIIVAALLIWVVYLQISANGENEKIQDDADTTVQEIQPPVSVPVPATDTVNTLDITTPKDSIIGFELAGKYTPDIDTIFKYYSLFKKKGHPVRIDSSENKKPRLLFRFNRPLKDTTYVSDSMRIWYRIRTNYFAPVNQ